MKAVGSSRRENELGSSKKTFSLRNFLSPTKLSGHGPVAFHLAGDENRAAGLEAAAEFRRPPCQCLRISARLLPKQRSMQLMAAPGCLASRRSKHHGVNGPMRETASPSGPLLRRAQRRRGTVVRGVPWPQCSQALAASATGPLLRFMVLGLRDALRFLPRNFHKKLLPRLAEKIHVFTTEAGCYRSAGGGVERKARRSLMRPCVPGFAVSAGGRNRGEHEGTTLKNRRQRGVRVFCSLRPRCGTSTASC